VRNRLAFGPRRADVVIADIDLSGAKGVGEALTQASVTDEIKALDRRSIAVADDLTQRAAAQPGAE